MSRNSLHRPRRNRAVWDRPATGTRLFPYPLPPNVPLHLPHYKRCPKAHRLRLRSDQSLSLPVHVTGYGRFPDMFRQALSKGPCQVRAALNRRNTLALSGDAHEHGVKLLPRAIVPRDSHRRCPRRGHATQRRQRVHAPISPYGRALLVVETAPHRDSLASLPRPLRSTGLSQSRRRCGTSAVADNTHRYRRRRLPAQPSGTFHPLPLSPPCLLPSRDDRPVAQGVGVPSGASTPLTPPMKGSAY